MDNKNDHVLISELSPQFIQTIKEYIVPFGSATELDLRNNEIQQLSNLDQLNSTELISLYLDGNKLKDLSGLPPLRYLKTFSASCNFLRYVSKSNTIFAFPALKHLDLSQNMISLLTAELPDSIEYLDLHCNRLNCDESIASVLTSGTIFNHLRVIDLRGNSIITLSCECGRAKYPEEQNLSTSFTNNFPEEYEFYACKNCSDMCTRLMKVAPNLKMFNGRPVIEFTFRENKGNTANKKYFFDDIVKELSMINTLKNHKEKLSSLETTLKPSQLTKSLQSSMSASNLSAIKVNYNDKSNGNSMDTSFSSSEQSIKTDLANTLTYAEAHKMSSKIFETPNGTYENLIKKQTQNELNNNSIIKKNEKKNEDNLFKEKEKRYTIFLENEELKRDLEIEKEKNKGLLNIVNKTQQSLTGGFLIDDISRILKETERNKNVNYYSDALNIKEDDNNMTVILKRQISSLVETIGIRDKLDITLMGNNNIKKMDIFNIKNKEYTKDQNFIKEQEKIEKILAQYRRSLFNYIYDNNVLKEKNKKLQLQIESLKNQQIENTHFIQAQLAEANSKVNFAELKTNEFSLYKDVAEKEKKILENRIEKLKNAMYGFKELATTLITKINVQYKQNKQTFTELNNKLNKCNNAIKKASEFIAKETKLNNKLEEENNELRKKNEDIEAKIKFLEKELIVIKQEKKEIEIQFESNKNELTTTKQLLNTISKNVSVTYEKSKSISDSIEKQNNIITEKYSTDNEKVKQTYKAEQEDAKKIERSSPKIPDYMTNNLTYNEKNNFKNSTITKESNFNYSVPKFYEPIIASGQYSSRNTSFNRSALNESSIDLDKSNFSQKNRGIEGYKFDNDKLVEILVNKKSTAQKPTISPIRQRKQEIIQTVFNMDLSD